MLSPDFLELLERFVPTAYEMKRIQDFEDGGRAEHLSEEDLFMRRFGRIPRLQQRMRTLAFMGSFTDSVRLIQPVRTRHACSRSIV